MGAGLFGLGAGTPSRFPYKGRPQPSPGVAPSQGIVVRARQVIVFGPSGTPTGFFLYRAGTTPALGNPPIASMTASTVDPFGNVVKPDITAYGTGGSTSYVQLAPGSPAAVNIGTGDSAEATPGQITGIVSGSGGSRFIIHDLRAATMAGENASSKAEVQLLSPSQDLTTSPDPSVALVAQNATHSASLQVTPASINTSQLLTVQNGLLVTSGSTFDGAVTLKPQQMSASPVMEQTDQSVITVIATSNAAITTAWAIPANDAQAGTVYRLKAGGYGDQGSTAETLKMQLSFMGLNIGSDTLPATVIPISTQFLWTFEGTVSVVSNGATGKARATGEFKIWELNGPNSAVMMIGQHAAVPPAADSTVNTTIAQTMSLGASWGSATGAPTITGAWSTLARAGA